MHPALCRLLARSNIVARIAAPFRNGIVLAGALVVLALPVSAGSMQPADVCGEWEALVPGKEPFSRKNHRMIYDPVRDRLVVYGGQPQEGVGGDYDVWVLSLGSPGEWTKLATRGAHGDQYQPAVVYDPVRDRMILFGGRYDGGPTSDVWALTFGDTSTWTELAPTGAAPSPFLEQDAVYDPLRDRMVVFGARFDPTGPCTTPRTNEVWALSLESPAWTQILPAGPTPTTTIVQNVIFDPQRDRAIVFGGGSPLVCRPELSDETWILSFSGTPAWSLAATQGTRPPPHAHVVTVLDAPRDRMVAFGGLRTIGDAQLQTNDVWSLQLATLEWSELQPNFGPAPLQEHAAIYDPIRQRLVSFGGIQAAEELWGLDLAAAPQWSWMPVMNARPPSRVDAATVYDAPGHRLILYGGYPAGGAVSDVWALDLDTREWTRLNTAGAIPAPRIHMSAIFDPVRRRMIVFGGNVYPPGTAAHSSPDATRSNEVWALSLEGTPTWSQLTPGGEPPLPRFGHTAIYDGTRDRMVIFSGRTETFGTNLPSDVWALPLADGAAWERITISGPSPPSRMNGSAIYQTSSDRMIVFGGVQGLDSFADKLGDTWALSFGSTPTWVQLTPEGGPHPSASHGAVYDPADERMYVFGGRRPDLGAHGLWALSLGAHPVWTPMNARGTPVAWTPSLQLLMDSENHRMVALGAAPALVRRIGQRSLFVGAVRRFDARRRRGAGRGWCGGSFAQQHLLRNRYERDAHGGACDRLRLRALGR